MLSGGGLLDPSAAGLFQFNPLFMAAAGMNPAALAGAGSQMQMQHMMSQLSPQQIQQLMQQQYLMLQQVSVNIFDVEWWLPLPLPFLLKIRGYGCSCHLSCVKASCFPKHF